MPEHYLLDSSAILALTDSEEGADQVEKLLAQAGAGEARVDISAASLMEVYYISLQEQGEVEAAHLVAALKAWPVGWAYPDERVFLLAGRLKAHRRMSFADAVIAATASALGATLVHKDPEFEDLAEEIPLLALPYKKKRS